MSTYVHKTRNTNFRGAAKHVLLLFRPFRFLVFHLRQHHARTRLKEVISAVGGFESLCACYHCGFEPRLEPTMTLTFCEMPTEMAPTTWSLPKNTQLRQQRVHLSNSIHSGSQILLATRFQNYTKETWHQISPSVTMEKESRFQSPRILKGKSTLD